jgi:hypothetical protein
VPCLCLGGRPRARKCCSTIALVCLGSSVTIPVTGLGGQASAWWGLLARLENRAVCPFRVFVHLLPFFWIAASRQQLGMLCVKALMMLGALYRPMRRAWTLSSFVFGGLASGLQALWCCRGCDVELIEDARGHGPCRRRLMRSHICPQLSTQPLPCAVLFAGGNPSQGLSSPWPRREPLRGLLRSGACLPAPPWQGHSKPGEAGRLPPSVALDCRGGGKTLRGLVSSVLKDLMAFLPD